MFVQIIVRIGFGLYYRFGSWKVEDELDKKKYNGYLEFNDLIIEWIRRWSFNLQMIVG